MPASRRRGSRSSVHGITAALTKGGPVWTADFTSLAAGPVSLAAYGLTFVRASSGYSVQSGTSAVVSTLGAPSLGSADVPRAGRLLDAYAIGLVLEEARTNAIVDSRDPTTAAWLVGSSVVQTRPSTAAPDGSATTSTRSAVTSTGYSRYTQPILASGTYTGSLWRIQGSAGVNNDQSDVGLSGAGVTVAAGGTAPAAWARRVITAAGHVGLAQVTLVPAIGLDYTAYGGIAAGARDVVCDLHQIEQGILQSRIHDTTGANSFGVTVSRNSTFLCANLLVNANVGGVLATEQSLISATAANGIGLVATNNTGAGGGVQLSDGSTIKALSSTFSSNAAGPGVAGYANCTIDIQTSTIASNGGLSGIYGDVGCKLELVTCVVNANAADGIQIDHGSSVQCIAVTSSVNNTGAGLRLKNSSNLSSSIGGNSVQGTGGVVIVGGNASIAWAAVAAGVTDIAAATPQLCQAGA